MNGGAQIGAYFGDVCVRCATDLCELQTLSYFSSCLRPSVFVSPFYLILSLCIPPSLARSFYPKYRIMTQFSWAVRASREMVTMATAPVLLSRPTVA